MRVRVQDVAQLVHEPEVVAFAAPQARLQGLAVHSQRRLLHLPDRPSLQHVARVHRALDRSDNGQPVARAGRQVSESEARDARLQRRHAAAGLQRPERVSVQSQVAGHLLVRGHLSRGLHAPHLLVARLARVPAPDRHARDEQRARRELRDDQHQQDTRLHAQSARRQLLRHHVHRRHAHRANSQRLHTPRVPGAQLLQPLQGPLAQAAPRPLQEAALAPLAEHGHREQRHQAGRVGADQPGGDRPQLDRSQRAGHAQDALRLAKHDLFVRRLLRRFHGQCMNTI